MVTDEGSEKKHINNKVSENYMQIPEQESQASIPFLDQFTPTQTLCPLPFFDLCHAVFESRKNLLPPFPKAIALTCKTGPREGQSPVNVHYMDHVTPHRITVQAGTIYSWEERPKASEGEDRDR